MLSRDCGLQMFSKVLVHKFKRRLFNYIDNQKGLEPHYSVYLDIRSLVHVTAHSQVRSTKKIGIAVCHTGAQYSKTERISAI